MPKITTFDRVAALALRFFAVTGAIRLLIPEPTYHWRDLGVALLLALAMGIQP